MGNRHKDHTSGMWMNASQILPAVRYRFIRDMVREQEKKEQEGAGPLSLWKQDAPAAKELISYIEAVTKEGGEDFIPPRNRIAVFDLDGTLFCETDPVYFEYRLLLHRVRDDETYRDQASEFEKSVAQKIETTIETGTAPEGLDLENGQAISSAFRVAGQTLYTWMPVGITLFRASFQASKSGCSSSVLKSTLST